MAAASCAGLLLLGVAWLSMVGEAENLSADPRHPSEPGQPHRRRG
jgi:hypothetical protein